MTLFLLKMGQIFFYATAFITIPKPQIYRRFGVFVPTIPYFFVPLHWIATTLVVNQNSDV